jgi:putative transposase
LATAIPSARSGQVWEHTIRDDTDFQRHVDYIHWNPVKHGVTKCIADWPYSSFHNYVRLGLLSSEWAATSTPATQHLPA